VRTFFYALLVLIVLGVGVAGFRGSRFRDPPIEIFPDMDRQPKYKSQTTTSFFPDGRMDRPPVPGAVEFGLPVEDHYLLTGKLDGTWGRGFPVVVTKELLQRGRERFDINCAVCHGRLGLGNGIAAQSGVNGVANYHSDIFRQMPEGQIYNTIVHGKGNMIGLPHLALQDRWAIVAYVRALQRSQMAPLDDVPEKEREALNKP
jgi:mono/diheme cytochrome c family protein